MNMEWFDREEFRQLCIDNNVMPAITGDNILVLTCPVLPLKEVQERIRGMIPQDIPCKFMETVSPLTFALLRQIVGQLEELLQVRIRNVFLKGLPNHKVVLEMDGVPRHEVTVPESPLWDKLVELLLKDLFTKSYKIMINGELYRDSEGYSKPNNLPATPEENEPILAPSPMKNRIPIRIKDDRFSCDREYLPKDVGVDVRILLESTNTVDEFLNSI